MGVFIDKRCRFLNKVNLVFLCNFKPGFIKQQKTNLKKKIFCKNFIIFLMFLNFFKTLRSTLFIKPLKKKTLAVLKAPHRFKSSRHLLTFSRYYITASLKISKSTYSFKYEEILSFFNTLFCTFKKIDSSICFQKFIKLSFIFSFLGI